MHRSKLIKLSFYTLAVALFFRGDDGPRRSRRRSTGTIRFFKNLKDGETVTLQYANGAHPSYGPALSATVKITVQ